MKKEIKILNDKEEEIKRRLFSIASLEGHDRYFYELFKNDTDFTDEQIGVMSGLYHLGGRGMFGQIIDDNLTKTCIKWILTGKNEYYEIIKDWFLWHLDYLIKERKEEKEKENKIQIEEIENKKKGYIYLLKSNRLYKIGRTKELENRIKIYQTENPFGIKVIFQKEVNDYVGVEAKLIEKFKDKNHRGEWFKLNKEDIQWIKSNI